MIRDLVLAASVNPITLVATASTQNPSNSTSLVITKPTGTADGDLLIAFVVASVASVTWSAPAGWTSVASVSSNRAYFKVASSEGANYTFTSDESRSLGGSIVAYRYASYDKVGNTVFGAGSQTLPAVTMAANNSVVLACCSSISSGATFAASGFTSVVSNSDASTPSWDIQSKSVNAGTTGDVAETLTGAAGMGGFLIAVKPT